MLKYIFSSVGQKQLMAVSGIGWALFVLGHMAGNLLIFLGPEIYNTYSHALISNPGIYIAEFGLLALLLTHIVFAISVSIKNYRSKTSAAFEPNKDKGTGFIAKTMKYQGILILIFIVIHLINFKFGPEYLVTYDEVEMRDLFTLVALKFQSPLYVSFYCVLVFILGAHLAHGINSSFLSLGLYSKKYDRLVRRSSIIYGVVIAIGFALPPIYLYFQQ